MIPDRLLACLKAPGAADDGSLERVDGAFRCSKTGAVYPDREGVPSLLAPSRPRDGDGITAKIKSFYEENPFPSYEGVQEFGDLVNRGQKTAFASDLLEAIGYNKLVLECGCGTGQLSHFLSLNNNHVLGIDLSLSSLKLAVEHKLRNEVPRVGFVEMNIFDLGDQGRMLRRGHLAPACCTTPRMRARAFASIVRKAKPGGLVVVGLYNWFARVPTWMRAQADRPARPQHRLRGAQPDPRQAQGRDLGQGPVLQPARDLALDRRGDGLVPREQRRLSQLRAADHGK